MALLRPVIHCVVDQEPLSFHDNARNTLRSFAVNLSFEVPVDAKPTEDDEKYAKKHFQTFLKLVQECRFYLYRVSEVNLPSSLTLSYLSKANSISAPTFDDPTELHEWLEAEGLKRSALQYWTTLEQVNRVEALPVDSAGASHRLRAAQSWNAPVAHRFALTHIVRVPRNYLGDLQLAVVPYFSAHDVPPDILDAEFVDEIYKPEDITADTEIKISYDPRGPMGKAVCRTTLVGRYLKTEVEPHMDEAGVTNDGYLTVDDDAENVRRLLNWFEERSASLMAANQGLSARGRDDEVDFNERFKFQVTTDKPTGKKTVTATAAAWYVAARLISALDNMVLALLKPSADDPASEGDVLAPFISALVPKLEPFHTDKSKTESKDILAAVRKALKESPLMKGRTGGSSKKDVADALRHTFNTSSAELSDDQKLVVVLLDCYEKDGTADAPSSLSPYLDSIGDGEGFEYIAIDKGLTEFEQKLQSEADVESALLRLIETATQASGGKFSALVAKMLLDGQPDDIIADGTAQVELAWNEYRATLEGPFNGAEAIRRAVGSSFVAALLRGLKLGRKGKSPTSHYLLRRIRLNSFYSWRFFDLVIALVKWFDPLRNALVVPDATLLQDGDIKALQKHLIRRFSESISEIMMLTKRATKFIPDTTPQPLAIQIASNIGGGGPDEFAKHFNGIAVAIRRRDYVKMGEEDKDQWAYAHLADLLWPVKPDYVPPIKAKAAIHPMLPAVSDGRGSMFIEYEGFPFSDPAFEERIVESGAEALDGRRPFYLHEPYSPAGFALVPRLAYGRVFETFSFITSNAGTLPYGLQRDQKEPWMPVQDVKPPADDELIGRSAYLRRTPIAQMDVVEHPRKSGGQKRIGASIAGVLPLASDYPRVGIYAEKDKAGARDILREADGSGMMIAQDIKNAEPIRLPDKGKWSIGGIQYSGTPSKLIIRFFDRRAEGPDDHGQAEFIIDSASVPNFTKIEEITVRIEYVVKFVSIPPGGPNIPLPPLPPFIIIPPMMVPVLERWLFVDCGAVPFKKRLPETGVIAGWLRLRLETDDKPATMTFADIGSQKTDNVPAPLLLLAPDAADWNNGLAEQAKVTISTPRVGYLDFERWFANANLKKRTFGGTSSKELMEALFIAYMLRHLDARLASYIERLPDPAVEDIRLELAVHDTLTGDKHSAFAEHFDIKDKLKEFAEKEMPTAVAEVIERYNEKSKIPYDPDKDATPWTPDLLVNLVFKKLDKIFGFDFIMEPGTLGLAPPKHNLPSFVATVPAGFNVKLSVDALAPSEHFKADPDFPKEGYPSVFHPELLQYVRRELPASKSAVPASAFPAAAIRIETMYDDKVLYSVRDKSKKNTYAIELAGSMIAADGIERTRRFDLMTKSDKEVPESIDGIDSRKKNIDHWRSIGEIDVTTQRWRATGRPIYNYVDPRGFRGTDLKGDKIDPKAPVAHPAMRLFLDDEEQLSQFELEAFFNRPNIDAHTITQRLDPLPARTKLQEHYWDAPSATYFRHRYLLRSRYSGALRRKELCEVPAWQIGDNIKTTAHEWTMRVAMLADIGRVTVTRPQLRALIPLTTAPGGEPTEAPSPPISAVLQEPPFARGGLADRLAAEMKTGFGYGFRDDAQHVEILDARKEAGPNPILDYRASTSGAVLGMVLRNEGPMGLTFDSVNAPAPAFPNTMLSLKPDVLRGKPPCFEEFFAGVAMRRYIDPCWSASNYVSGNDLEGERCWWIDLPLPDRSPLQMTFRAEKEFSPVFTAEIVERGPEGARERLFEVRVPKMLIDGVGSTDEDCPDVTILRIAADNAQSVAALHQPIAPGRYSTSIFVGTASAQTEAGHINAPMILASFEWSAIKPGSDGQQPPSNERQPPFVKLYLNRSTTARETLASAITSLRWAKTSRDFDFVSILESSEDIWVSKPQRVRDLVADLDGKHYKLSFRRAGSDKKVWLRPSTFTNPYPVHVHRHLGVITSRFLKELGRPSEIFCRTAAMRGQEPILIKDGEIPDFGSIYKDREDIVRVVEFETPAAIICDEETAKNTPITYRQAYFDLVSTGFQHGKEKDGTLRLHFRFVGQPTHLRGFSEFVVKLWPASKEQEISEAPHILKIKLKPDNDTFAVGADVILRREKDKMEDVEVNLLRSDGTLKSATVDESGNPLDLVNATMDQPGLFVSLDADGTAEFWADVSILHSPNGKAIDPLDFGWLFSASEKMEPSAHVAPAGLNTMVEAQARIVTVSPPIPIVSHG